MIVNILEDGTFQRRDYGIFTPTFPFGQVLAVESKDYQSEDSGEAPGVLVIDCGNGKFVATTGFTALDLGFDEIRITSKKAVRKLLETVDFGIYGENVKYIYLCHIEWEPVWMLIAEFDPKPPRTRLEELFQNTDGYTAVQIDSISFTTAQTLSSVVEVLP